MIEEVNDLIKKGVSEERLIRFGLEYKWCTEYLLKKISFSDLVEGLSQAIGKFAKRQRTWFRRMERNGTKINWLDGNLSVTEQCDLIKSYISS